MGPATTRSLQEVSPSIPDESRPASPAGNSGNGDQDPGTNTTLSFSQRHTDAQHSAVKGKMEGRKPHFLTPGLRGEMGFSQAPPHKLPALGKPEARAQAASQVQRCLGQETLVMEAPSQFHFKNGGGKMGTLAFLQARTSRGLEVLLSLEAHKSQAGAGRGQHRGEGCKPWLS